MTPTHVLLTHHHYDHVCELDELLARWPDLHVLIHPLERELVPQANGDLIPGEPVRAAGMEITPIHTPGHTAGMVALLVDGQLFTGDTLFRNSGGGVRAPGHTTYEDLRDSIMGALMELPPETVIRPGHTDPTTVGEEWETNSFIRVWRGLDPEGEEACTAMGEPATLILLGDDYDGGHARATRATSRRPVCGARPPSDAWPPPRRPSTPRRARPTWAARRTTRPMRWAAASSTPRSRWCVCWAG